MQEKKYAAGAVDFKQDSGPLKPYLSDPDVNEIMVNRWDVIFIEKNGQIFELEKGFENAEALTRFAQSIAVAAGRELNRRHPCLDSRLPDGSRLHIAVPPVSVDGPTFCLRKHKKQALNHRDLTIAGSVDDKMVVFLYQLVRCRQNLVVSGGTSSGKTTLLNVLSSFIPSRERIITIEDNAELSLQVRNLVRLEAKPAMGADPGITMHELANNALRMRPDRIVLGECRGEEAWDMLLAMNTGHDGSMTTLHSNSAYDSLRRMEAMILRAGLQAPLTMIKTDIASTVNFVVHMERMSDGKRRVVEVVEVLGRDGDEYKTQPVFVWSSTNGFKSTGYVPRFVTTSNHPEMKMNAEFFQPTYKYKAAA